MYVYSCHLQHALCKVDDKCSVSLGNVKCLLSGKSKLGAWHELHRYISQSTYFSRNVIHDVFGFLCMSVFMMTYEKFQ